MYLRESDVNANQATEVEGNEICLSVDHLGVTVEDEIQIEVSSSH